MHEEYSESQNKLNNVKIEQARQECDQWKHMHEICYKEKTGLTNSLSKSQNNVTNLQSEVCNLKLELISMSTKLANQQQKTPVEKLLRTQLNASETEWGRLNAQIKEMEGWAFEKQRLKCLMDDTSKKLREKQLELNILSDKHLKVQEDLVKAHDEVIAWKIHPQSEGDGAFQTVHLKKHGQQNPELENHKPIDQMPIKGSDGQEREEMPIYFCGEEMPLSNFSKCKHGCTIHAFGHKF